MRSGDPHVMGRIQEPVAWGLFKGSVAMNSKQVQVYYVLLYQYWNTDIQLSLILSRVIWASKFSGLALLLT